MKTKIMVRFPGKNFINILRVKGLIIMTLNYTSTHLLETQFIFWEKLLRAIVCKGNVYLSKETSMGMTILEYTH